MSWLLLLALPFVPFVFGYLVGLLVFLTPTLKWKLKVAHALIASPFRLVSRGMALSVRKEVEWIVCMKYGDADLRPLYQNVYEKAWAD